MQNSLQQNIGIDLEPVSGMGKKISSSIRGRIYTHFAVKKKKDIEITKNITNDQEVSDQRYLDVRIFNAKNIGKADYFGKSDPYCIVRWNGEEIGRTDIIAKSLDPEWDNNATIRFKINGELKDQEFEIELRDFDALGSGNFLGVVSLTKDDLENVITTDEIQIRPLIPRPGMTEKESKIVQGELSFRADVKSLLDEEFDILEDEDNVDPDKVKVLEVTLQKAISLGKADLFGKSDPFVKVIWNGEEIGRTRTIWKTLDPIWNETFKIFYRFEVIQS